MSHRGIFSKTHLSLTPVSLPPFVSRRGLSNTNQRLSLTPVRVALKLRSLRFHSPRLCRIAVLLIQTNVSRSDSRFSTQANVPIKTVPPPLGGHSDTAHAGLAQHRRQPRAGRHCVLRWRLMFITYYIRMSLRHRTSWLRRSRQAPRLIPHLYMYVYVCIYI